MSSTPSLSCVLCVRHSLAVARRTLRALGRQGRSDLELVMVMDARHLPELDRYRPLLGDVKLTVVDFPVGKTAAEGWALGLRAASGDYAAMLEDHCWPEDGWADALIEAAAPGVAAMGPSIRNGNPATALSWADYGCGLGAYANAPAGDTSATASHNTCYHRASVLEVWGDALASAFHNERALQRALIDSGRTLQSVPGARVLHVNLSRWMPYLQHKLVGGWLFAAQRCTDWSLLRRAVYALGSPLIPLVRLLRWSGTIAGWQESERQQMLRALPHYCVGLAAHAAGELLGYLSGDGALPKIYPLYSEAELSRWYGVQAEDLALLDQA